MTHAVCRMAQSAYGGACPYHRHYSCIVSLCQFMKQYNTDKKKQTPGLDSLSFNEMRLQFNPLKKRIT